MAHSTNSVYTRVRDAYRRNAGEKFCPWCGRWRRIEMFEPGSRRCRECGEKRRR